MLTKKTVFIVGAGGSKELGLPVGDELKAIIRDKLSFRVERNDIVDGDPILLEALTRAVSEKNLRSYVAAAQNIAAAMPLALSIDNYLHTHAADDRAVLMGKLAITTAIMEAEKGCSIYQDRSDPLHFDSITPSWHTELAKMLFENVQVADLPQVFDNLTIITFNYDRCIEHYIFNALQRYFLIEKGQAKDLCYGLKVLHPYGEIGKLPWQRPAEIHRSQFGTMPEVGNLMDLSFHIQTFTERETDKARLAHLKDPISEAETVIFLGFSFGRINMELLSTDKDGPLKKVLATAFGISPTNRAAIQHAINQSFSGPGGSQVGEIRFSDNRCAEFMNENWWDIIG